MSADEADNTVRELRQTPWVALGVGLAGAFLLLVAAAVMGVLWLDPPKNPPPAPWVPYAVLVVGAVMLVAGVAGYWSAPVAMRVSPRGIELAKLKVTIPWGDIEEIDAEQILSPKIGAVSLLVMRLTSAGRQAIGQRQLSNTSQANLLDVPSDVCLKCDFVTFGSDIDSLVDFAHYLRRRRAAATGEPDRTPELPPMNGKLELRDVSATGSDMRVYVHDACGQGTAVSAGSLPWISNPLRYTSGTAICSHCGEALDFTLRWEDTGETLRRFRRRMWRQTSILVKVLQFVVVPALLAAGLTLALPKFVPLAQNLSPMVASGVLFGSAFIGANMLLLLTPLAGVVPRLAGYNYHLYR